MMRKQRDYLVVLVVIVATIALFGFKETNPSLRQPQIGAAVHPMAKRYLMKKNFAEAQTTADRLDSQVRSLIEASSMHFLQRLIKSVDLKTLESRYVNDIQHHLQAMTTVMKVRREQQGLRNLQEFDFQNLLRRSDYLLSLELSVRHLHKLSPEILEKYKYERENCNSKKWASL